MIRTPEIDPEYVLVAAGALMFASFTIAAVVVARAFTG